MVWPIVAAAAVTAAASIYSAYASNKGKNKESKSQKQKRHLTDELIYSLSGKGKYADLYKFDQNSFNTSFVEPAKARFRNEIAPGIQQQYIGSGQQGSSSLNDSLLRAGVEMDQLLNERMMTYQENAKNRKQGALNAALGVPFGAPAQMSGSEAAQQGAGGYLASSQFADTVSSLSKSGNNETAANARPGYSQDWGYTAGDQGQWA